MAGAAACLICALVSGVNAGDFGAEQDSLFDFSFTISEFNETVWKSHLLIEAIIQIESSGQPGTVGQAGERGLMQIKRQTWAEICPAVYGRTLSFDLAFDPCINRCVGAAYLEYLQDFIGKHRPDRPEDERELLLACYNAGPERVRAAGFSLKFLPKTTQDYVRRAGTLHDHYLSKTSPKTMFSMASSTR